MNDERWKKLRLDETEEMPSCSLWRRPEFPTAWRIPIAGHQEEAISELIWQKSACLWRFSRRETVEYTMPGCLQFWCCFEGRLRAPRAQSRACAARLLGLHIRPCQLLPCCCCCCCCGTRVKVSGERSRVKVSGQGQRSRSAVVWAGVFFGTWAEAATPERWSFRRIVSGSWAQGPSRKRYDASSVDIVSFDTRGIFERPAQHSIDSRA